MGSIVASREVNLLTDNSKGEFTLATPPKPKEKPLMEYPRGGKAATLPAST